MLETKLASASQKTRDQSHITNRMVDVLFGDAVPDFLRSNVKTIDELAKENQSTLGLAYEVKHLGERISMELKLYIDHVRFHHRQATTLVFERAGQTEYLSTGPRLLGAELMSVEGSAIAGSRVKMRVINLSSAELDCRSAVAKFGPKKPVQPQELSSKSKSHDEENDAYEKWQAALKDWEQSKFITTGDRPVFPYILRPGKWTEIVFPVDAPPSEIGYLEVSFPIVFPSVLAQKP